MVGLGTLGRLYVHLGVPNQWRNKGGTMRPGIRDEYHATFIDGCAYPARTPTFAKVLLIKECCVYSWLSAYWI